MISDLPTPEAVIKQHYGSAVNIIEKRVLAGGCINQAYQLRLSNGEHLFLKENSASHKLMFQREAEGLCALTTASGPRVPRPIGYYSSAATQFLILEWIETSQPSQNFWENFGHTLAQLHQNFGSSFGFSTNNYIGTTIQKNRWETDWPTFFGQNRLLFQMQKAQKQKCIDLESSHKLEKLIERLPTILNLGKIKPSLLHGDLWIGNYLVGPDGEAVLIDPAVYYGHREADLAMTELFGHFNQRFYEAYIETFSLEPGYEVRRELYNLYHLLNHLNIFGAAYLDSVKSVINRFV